MSLVDSNVISPIKEQSPKDGAIDKSLDGVFMQDDENRSPHEMLGGKLKLNDSSSSSSSNGMLSTPFINKKLKKKGKNMKKSPEDVKAAIHELMKVQLGKGTPAKVLNSTFGHPRQLNAQAGISSAAQFHRAFGRRQHQDGQGSSSASQGSPKGGKTNKHQLKYKEDSWGLCVMADIEKWKNRPAEEMDSGYAKALREWNEMEEVVREHMEEGEFDSDGDLDLRKFGLNHEGPWSLDNKSAKNEQLDEKRRLMNELSPFLSFKTSSSSSSSSEASDFKEVAGQLPVPKREESILVLRHKPGTMFKQSIMNKHVKEEKVSPKSNNSDETPVVIEGPVVVKEEPDSPEGDEEKGAKRKIKQKAPHKNKVAREAEEEQSGDEVMDEEAAEPEEQIKLRRSERIQNISLNGSGSVGGRAGWNTPRGGGSAGRARGGAMGARGGRGGPVGRGALAGRGGMGRGGGLVGRGTPGGRGIGRGGRGQGLMCGTCGQQTPRGGAARGQNALSKTQRKAIRKRLQHQFKVRRLRNKLSLATQRYQQRRIRNRVRHNLKLARINLRYAIGHQQEGHVQEQEEEVEDEGEEDMDTTVDSSGSETSSGDSSFVPGDGEDNDSGGETSGNEEGGGQEEDGMELGAEAMAGA